MEDFGTGLMSAVGRTEWAILVETWKKYVPCED